MALRGNDDEKAIVSAFLRTGHPWMAFGTVLIKSGVRIAAAAALVGLALEQSAAIPALLKILRISL
jgi:hypothetical protein